MLKLHLSRLIPAAYLSPQFSLTIARNMLWNVYNELEQNNFFKLNFFFLCSTQEVTCDFKTQRIWIFLWLSLNIVAILTLVIAEILFFTQLGWWSMTYDHIHVTVFFMVLILLVLLIYGQVIGES